MENKIHDTNENRKSCCREHIRTQRVVYILFFFVCMKIHRIMYQIHLRFLQLLPQTFSAEHSKNYCTLTAAASNVIAVLRASQHSTDANDFVCCAAAAQENCICYSSSLL